MSRLLIDADIIAFRASAAVEHPINWGGGLWTLHSYEHDAINAIEEQLKTLAKAPVDSFLMAISDKKNYRKQVASYYKANRKDTRKPMLLEFCKEYLRDEYPSAIYPNLEADDVLGILGTENPNDIIWSVDKDLLTIPAKHWVDEKVIQVTEEEAYRRFLKQCLTGDAVDNYKGCPTIGDKTADKILDKACCWAQVVMTYESKGLTEKDALENARLARILRKGEYNRETHAVKLWRGE